MERRKLVIEKVLDGEVDLYWAAEATAEETRGIVRNVASGVERLRFDTADVLESLKSLRFGDTFAPPFDSMWLEFHLKECADVLRGQVYCALVVGGLATVFVKSEVGTAFGALGSARVDLPFSAPAAIDVDLSVLTPEGLDAEAIEHRKNVVRCAVLDVQGAVALLNVQGDVVRERLEAPAEVNAKRVKRGKPQLQPYTYVYLNRETDHSTAGESTGRIMSQHIRRGHFKRTRHGTFWWRPCVVGSGPAKERKAYIVKR